ncbi:MAG: CBS domain-containing protein [Candidatus Omnitrophica bacterium]|nr:CBS domain-containing protein [Candidatus Omnitrophota bacterium]
MFRRKYLGIITGEVVTAGEDTSVKDAAMLMRENNIGIIVILNDEKVVGTVSEREITRSIAAEGLSAAETKCGEIMNKDVVSTQIKDGLNKLYQMLCECKCRHLIVLDGERLVGITSRRDMLDALSNKKKYGFNFSI